MDDMQDRIKAMSDGLDNREFLEMAQVQCFVQRGLAIARQVSATVDDIGRESIDKITIMTVRELKTGAVLFHF